MVSTAPLLRQQLIDENSLVLALIAIGGKSTPSIFDGGELMDLDDVYELELKKQSQLVMVLCGFHYYKKKELNQEIGTKR
ncbi:hypothetical protein [Halobacillus sp. H74]|uniref:hypothetical protein n=1 Tax=Halobacillus sp. H74 TaxID=3457436 RepID=UPI003FCE3830